MAASVLVDTGFVIALLSRRDRHHKWAVAQSPGLPPPWKTCDAVLSEAFHLLGSRGGPALSALLHRGAVLLAFDLADELDRVLDLMRKYADVPMSLADACLVRMSETVADPVILTTDADFRIYRRHGRQVVPCVTPR
jgi:predicted nucleic acid-binding protein